MVNQTYVPYAINIYLWMAIEMIFLVHFIFYVDL